MPLLKFEFPITVEKEETRVQRLCRSRMRGIVSIQEQNNRINSIVITHGCALSSHGDLGAIRGARRREQSEGIRTCKMDSDKLRPARALAIRFKPMQSD